ncbi:MAG: motility protein A, partial [Desulfatirhabdiaceae bacterium]
MDITTLIGILVAGGLVISAILMGGSGIWFLDYPSLMIVFGGTMGATLVAYPLSEVLSVVGIAKNAFLHRSQAPMSIIPILVEFAKKARKDGILSFESRLKEIDNPFLAKGIQMAIDGMEASAIENVLSTEIAYIGERHKLGADIFSSMGSFAPAIGMLGTIIGLVQMLRQMSDPSLIGAPMAVALLTTFYGTILSNLLFVPIAEKLKTRSKQEVLVKEMILEGILAIQSGYNHRIVEQKLIVFLSQKVQDKI